MDRRTFNKMVGLGMLGGMDALHGRLGAVQSPPETTTAPLPKWPDNVYRRLLIDMHIPDWDQAFLSKFDPVEHVRTIARAGFKSYHAFATSLVGLCLWRTKLGEMHAAMKGRDWFGETLDECKRQNVHALGYYNLVYDNWAYTKNPDWRIVTDPGGPSFIGNRYAVVCPNSPYREHAFGCLRELVTNYDFEGIFIDMVFWPAICYCRHCTARFQREQGVAPPHVVDWNDPTWRRFQKSRQAWILEFAKSASQTMKDIRPVKVCIQYSVAFFNWMIAAPLELRDASDYASGDFYGGPEFHSLVCKAFHGLTRNRPIEYMTSRTPNLRDHVTIKPIEQIRIESFVAPLHSAAFLMIDAINPDGTLNQAVYDFAPKLNMQRAAYEPFYGGELLADCAIYYDKESFYNPNEQKVRVGELNALDDCPHRDGVVGLARIFREAHVPFGIVTNVTLDQLKSYRAVLLPNVLEMTAEQAALFRDFVRSGGVLYASGPSSLDRFDKNGPRYFLEDVFGVRYVGTEGTKVTYLSPKDEAVRKIFWPQDALIFTGPMIKAEALPGAEVMATVTLPWVTPEMHGGPGRRYSPWISPELGYAMGSRFASLHSDPPALTPGTNPGLVIHSFGKGKAIWVAAPIEARKEDVNARLLVAVLKRVLPGPYQFEAETHPSVEITLFHQAEKKRLLVGLLSMQQQLPPIAVPATVRVQVPSGRRVKSVIHLPEQKALRFELAAPYVQFKLEPFEDLSMALIEYQ